MVAKQGAAAQLRLGVADAQQAAVRDPLLGDHGHAARLHDFGEFLEQAVVEVRGELSTVTCRAKSGGNRLGAA